MHCQLTSDRAAEGNAHDPAVGELSGLALDFAGFAMLLREWWLAFYNEGRRIEMEEQLQRMQSLRNLRPVAQGGALAGAWPIAG